MPRRFTYTVTTDNYDIAKDLWEVVNRHLEKRWWKRTTREFRDDEKEASHVDSDSSSDYWRK